MGRNGEGEGAREALDRRKFLRMGMLGTVATAGGFSLVGNVAARAAAEDLSSRVVPKRKVAPGLVQAGPELALQPGFSYKTLSLFGTAMSDGFLTPPLHDGMGVFPGPNGTYKLVRNHELGEGNDIPAGTVIGIPDYAYDKKSPGGTTTLTVDADANLLDCFISMNGTNTNCSGTPTPWGTWLSCEETVVGDGFGLDRPHGYIFEVDPNATGPKKHKPLKAMGRFVHEAGAVDENTGVVYMTEDDNPDGFYRFIPKVPGTLAKGGRIQMLGIKGEPGYGTVTGQRVGDRLPVIWIDIHDPEPSNIEDDATAVYRQGRNKGGAKFLSGEGCTYRNGSVVFDSSDGGDAGLGQIWEYTPKSNIGEVDEEGELVLLYESTDKLKLDGPDNMCTSPGGAIVVVEDGNDRTNFIRCLLPDGSMFSLAENLIQVRLQLIDASGKTYDPNVPNDDLGIGAGLGASEFAGPRFSPDGKWLFVNIQVPGITFAITGPWASLGL